MQTSADARRKASIRTGIVLASIAAVFFVGIIASRLFGTPEASIGVIGTAVLLFLVVAIGGSLRNAFRGKDRSGR